MSQMNSHIKQVIDQLSLINADGERLKDSALEVMERSKEGAPGVMGVKRALLL